MPNDYEIQESTLSTENQRLALTIMGVCWTERGVPDATRIRSGLAEMLPNENNIWQVFVFEESARYSYKIYHYTNIIKVNIKGYHFLAYCKSSHSLSQQMREQTRQVSI